MKIAKGFTAQFSEVVKMIHQAQYNAIKSVNAELVKLYWNIGEYISKKLSSAEWGDAVVDHLADYIQTKHPEFKGFTRRGLYRMLQFYETYCNNQFVSALLTQINWSNHLLILSKTKSDEERQFYLQLSIKEKYTSREMERQIDSGYYERAMLSKKKVSPVVTQLHGDITNVFKDTYVLDFLNLPKTYSEKELQKSIVANLRDFILEFGKDFAFIGQEYRIQVGKNDYFIDLLFFHRSLKCLVMVELKIDDFKPEYLGKLNFYLEAIDRDVRKPDENPSVGIILCKSKDDEVVEYALSRNLSPSLVAEYKTKLIPKKILQKKLHEYYLLGQKDRDKNK
ncbi:MAG: PDDEXK nuclease domain-containing protein [Thermodesulfovibrionia bacterium]|nr:PDDEXK nuclease domain-containing protein [Thermodesulfovibrionia bacterium]